MKELIKFNNDPEWLEKHGDNGECVSAGGLGAREISPKRKVAVTIVIEGGCYQDILCDDPDIEFEVTVDDRDAGDDECQHEEHEDCLICATCGKCRESLDEEDICADCRAEEEKENA